MPAVLIQPAIHELQVNVPSVMQLKCVFHLLYPICSENPLGYFALLRRNEIILIYARLLCICSSRLVSLLRRKHERHATNITCVFYDSRESLVRLPCAVWEMLVRLSTQRQNRTSSKAFFEFHVSFFSASQSLFLSAILAPTPATTYTRSYTRCRSAQSYLLIPTPI